MRVGDFPGSPEERSFKMGIFGRKKKKPEKKGPMVVDPDVFLLDKGRTLASQEKFMEAVCLTTTISSV
jgi:hypothetical protein